jgi:murein DD-endopeptidase MepM/ murein hydrolase activator NlpD
MTLKTKTFYTTFILSFLFLLKASAQTSADDIRNSINSTNEQIKKLEQEIAEYSKTVTNTQKEATTLKEALKTLENRKANLEKQIKLTGYKMDATKNEISNTVKKIEDTNLRIQTLSSGLSNSLRDKVKMLNLNSEILTYTSANNFADLYDKLHMNEDFQINIRETSSDLKNLNQDLNKTKTEYQDQYKNLTELKDDLKDKQTSVLATQKEKDELLKSTKQKEENYKKLLEDRKKKKLALEKEVLDYESKLKAIVDISKLPKSGTGVLQYPVKKVIITQYFGNTAFSTQNPQVYNGSGHNGIDFGLPVGTAIYSAGDGRVIGVGNSDLACSGVSYGKWILIKHNNGLSTLYAHLSSFDVSQGDSVASGQKIASSGNTGYSTGPHLHFTVYASDAVRVSGPGEYKSKVCGTDLLIPVAPRNGYLNPLTYL